MMQGRGCAALFLVFASVTAVEAQPSVILVRHAERMDAAAAGPTMMASDPELSGAGLQRAESLARILKDARITAIYTTEFRRTTQTAAPLARLLALEPTVVPSKDVNGLVGKIRSSTGAVLVVGHSNTIPEILRALGVSESVTIGELEFDNLFVVQRGSMVRMRYQ